MHSNFLTFNHCIEFYIKLFSVSLWNSTSNFFHHIWGNMSISYFKPGLYAMQKILFIILDFVSKFWQYYWSCSHRHRFLFIHFQCVNFNSGWIRGRDPSRVVHYEGGGSRTSSTDIVCPMYMRVWDILKIAKDPSETRPLILCEYVVYVLKYVTFFFKVQYFLIIPWLSFLFL